MMNRAAEQTRQDPDRGPTRTQVEARKKSVATSGPGAVENYIGFPVSDRLRAKLEAFLSTVAIEGSEEVSYALLLERGLDSIQEAASRRTKNGADRGRLMRRALLARLVR